jgi:hypothetical protein
MCVLQPPRYDLAVVLVYEPVTSSRIVDIFAFDSYCNLIAWYAEIPWENGPVISTSHLKYKLVFGGDPYAHPTLVCEFELKRKNDTAVRASD